MTLDCFEHKMWHHCIKMEFQKNANFLYITSDDKDLPKFVTKKWIEVYDQSGGNYNVNKETRIKKTTGSLWNYYRDEPSDPLSSNSESFKYKTSITGNTYNVGVGEDGYDADKVGKNRT